MAQHSRFRCLRQIGIIDLIQWIFLIALSIQAIFFTKEVFIEFASNDTSMKQNEVDLLEVPTITICFKDNEDYVYGVDLNISVDHAILDMADKDSDYYENLLYFNYDNDIASIVVLEKIFCWADTQVCFKITRPNDQVYEKIPKQFDIKVEFNESIAQMPDIEVFFTSEENAYGIIFKDWMDGLEMTKEFKKV